jgi:hypothetical protein
MSDRICAYEINAQYPLRCSFLAILVGGLSFVLGCAPTSYPSSPPPTLTNLQSNVFDSTCNGGGCHSGTQPAAQLDLSPGNSYSSLLTHRIENDTGRKYYTARVARGDPSTSFLIAKLTGNLTPDEGDQMPQRLHPLPQTQIDAVREWIQHGAQNN